MKDYTKEISNLAIKNDWPPITVVAMDEIAAIILADVEAEEKRLHTELQRQYDEVNRLALEVERLKEENENLKDLNNKLELQAKGQPSTREQREWEMFKDIVVRDDDSNEGHFRSSANLAKRAVSVFYDFQEGYKA